MPIEPLVAIDLYWLPLGVGGQSVRLNGKVYEAAVPLVERRRGFDLYHSALEVHVPEGSDLGSGLNGMVQLRERPLA